jgi:hypothetical protein
MRIADLSDHRHAIALIEAEFGVHWLHDDTSDGHPVKERWRQASAALDAYDTTGKFEVTEDILVLTRFAEELEIAKGCLNYDRAIKPRLRADEFAKVEYEVYVSALCVNAGYSTEFIPTAETRTADLRLRRENSELHVECTRKDPYIPIQRDGDGPTVALLDSLRNRRLAGLEVIVIILSELRDSDIPAILNDIKQIENDADRYLLRRTRYGVYVRKLPPPEGDGHWMTFEVGPPFTLENGIFVPAGKDPAWAEAAVAVDAAGRRTLTGHYRVYLHTIDSHALLESPHFDCSPWGRKMRREAPWASTGGRQTADASSARSSSGQRSSGS